MSFLLKDILHNDTILSYDGQIEYFETIYLLPVALTGILAISYLLIVNLGRPNVPSVKLIYTLCFSDLLLLILIFILAVLNNAAGGWGAGRLGCIISCIMILTLGLHTMVCITSIALERYLSVCRSIQLSNKQIWILVVLGVIIPFIPTLVLLSQNYESTIAMTRTKNSCLVAWYVPESLAVVIVTGIIGFSSIIIVVACYFMVYMVFIRAFRNYKGIHKDNELKKMSVLQSCIALSCVFAFCWLGKAAAICYELIMQERVSAIFQTITDDLVILNCALDPFILMLFDNRILGMKWITKRRVTSTSQKDRQPEVSIESVPSAPQATCIPKTVFIE